MNSLTLFDFLFVDPFYLYFSFHAFDAKVYLSLEPAFAQRGDADFYWMSFKYVFFHPKAITKLLPVKTLSINLLLSSMM